MNIPGYRVEEEVGRSDSAVVYRAVRLATERPVALKVLARERGAEPGFGARFLHYCEAVASLDHPHVLPAYDFGEADGLLWVAMHWVEGTDLRALAPLDPARAALIVAQVAGALDAAHACGLVHGDVKPANVLVESRAEGEHAYLAGIGLARHGSADFAAPEAARGWPADPRGDVYSLGCLLGYAVTGSVPFPRSDPAATVQAHLHEPPPRLPPAAAALDPVVGRALAKDPAWRFESAGALGDTALAATGVAIDRGASADRRLRPAAIVAVAVGFALLIAGIVTIAVVIDRDSEDPTVEQDPNRPLGTLELNSFGDERLSGTVEVARDGPLTSVVVRARLRPLEKDQVYEAWLYNNPADVYSLGWEKPNRAGELDLLEYMPDGYTKYRYIDISVERERSNGFHSERSVLRGELADLEPVE